MNKFSERMTSIPIASFLNSIDDFFWNDDFMCSTTSGF